MTKYVSDDTEIVMSIRIELCNAILEKNYTHIGAKLFFALQFICE